MQYANIMLALGGDAGTTVPKDEVSASEIAVLRLIHGAESVFDVEPVSVDEAKSNRTSREEIRRLTEIYGGARVQTEDGTDASAIQLLFPGAGAQAVKNLEDLDIPEAFFKALARVSANAATEPADQGDGLDKMSKSQLLEEAERRGIEVAVNASKAAIVAAIRASVEGAGGAGKEVFG